MAAFVLDASAIIRYLDDEPGAERVEAILKLATRGTVQVYLSAIQWGEIAGNLRRRYGAADQRRFLDAALPTELQIEPATAERAMRAAELKVDRKIAYADAFALGLALEKPESVLVTADYGFKAVEELTRIEFLPPK